MNYKDYVLVELACPTRQNNKKNYTISWSVCAEQIRCTMDNDQTLKKISPSFRYSTTVSIELQG
ncbi:CLUMA_CG021198, isoform A [Clunio marinus]|uniref:CLUMA_CG021198, isoform A n=1 Tax=Clunio marinus TaxID=568069 RepID=A0A1J1J732_9DIPT|nr:CLUMA_CG021198, isoform A [Clunio marinus]